MPDPLDVLVESHDELGGGERIAGKGRYKGVVPRTEAHQSETSPHREASDRDGGVRRLPLLQKKLCAGDEDGGLGDARCTYCTGDRWRRVRDLDGRQLPSGVEGERHAELFGGVEQ